MEEKTTTEFIAYHKFPKLNDPLIPADHEIIKGFTVDQLKKEFNLSDEDLDRFIVPIYEEVLWMNDNIRDNMVSYPERPLIVSKEGFTTFMSLAKFIEMTWTPFPHVACLSQEDQKELDEIIKEYNLK